MPELNLSSRLILDAVIVAVWVFLFRGIIYGFPQPVQLDGLIFLFVSATLLSWVITITVYAVFGREES